MKTRERKASDRQSLSELMARLLAEVSGLRLENRQMKDAIARIESEQASNYREYHGLTLELMERAARS